MKTIKHSYIIVLLIAPLLIAAQNIQSIQLFNPKTNDQTPIIALGEYLILRFDDLENNSTQYRYTIKHYDRNWQEDQLFHSEYATGPLSATIDEMQYSFNTLQKYTHYELTIPNEKIKIKLSGNYKIIVYKNSPNNPIFTKKFSVYENQANIGIRQTRLATAQSDKAKNQKVEVVATLQNTNHMANINTFDLTILQNNNWETAKNNIKPSSTNANSILYQQLDLAFAGNNQFYYFDNKNINMGFDRVAAGEIIDQQNHTYLHPTIAYPLDYQYQPDVNGAYYYRRNDLGVERNANTEADYSWVHFYLDSHPINKKIYILGGFNSYQPDEKYMMSYNHDTQQYTTKIYLKQGFYNYTIATQEQNETPNLAEINGNFWQTKNLYQAIIYYKPFGQNYDGIIGYGETRQTVK